MNKAFFPDFLYIVVEIMREEKTINKALFSDLLYTVVEIMREEKKMIPSWSIGMEQ